jgi:penicillin-binding protein 1C
MTEPNAMSKALHINYKICIAWNPSPASGRGAWGEGDRQGNERKSIGFVSNLILHRKILRSCDLPHPLPLSRLRARGGNRHVALGQNTGWARFCGHPTYQWLTNIALSIGLALLSSTATAAPTPEEVKASYRPSEAELLDRHGERIQTLRIDMTVRRLPWVPLKDISPAVSGAILQAEDQRFYQHHGVDLEALGKAAWDNLFRKNPRGASTITMQLASMLNQQLQPKHGTRSWEQKWDQIQAAKELEATWTKPQILEAYFNLVTYRGEQQGIGAVSQNLFGKAPSGLNEIESIILGSLIRAPNASAKQVAKRACSLAKESKLTMSCSSIEMTVQTTLSGALARNTSPLAPHVALKLLKTPGEKVTSTLDASLQRFATDSLRRQLLSLGKRNVNDGAIVVLDNRSGDILAYVGNAGNNNVDGVAALRQAGSTLKPFLYELAIERKLLTAASVMDDSPIDISTPAGLYVPQNYDKDFKGNVSVRTSLASSLNVPAVRTLVMLGMEPFYIRLKELGLNSLTESADYYGYALALGSAEVSLLDLANAYRALADHGMVSSTSLVPRPTPSKKRLLDIRAAFIVGDILSDRAARSTTFGLSNELATAFWSAVKTGTSKDMRDNWCVGYSEKYTVGVWVGNFDGQPMWDVSGVTGAAPVWHDVMNYLHRGVPARRPKAPPNVVAQEIEFIPQVEAPRKEWFISGTEKTKIELLAETDRPSKIRYPGRDSIIAIDPDIPDERQRVFFQAQAGKGHVWRLDGAILSKANMDFAWSPQPGTHRLELLNAEGNAVDSIDFQVRGSARTAVKTDTN